MKYIRTKDGIYELDTKHSNNNWIEVKLGNGWNYHLLPNEIISQADTIEELCDEFVVIYNESKKFTKPFTSAYCDIKDVLKEHDLSECNIYGAIWTSKGLIYVAKLNDKGDLELL